MQDYNKDYYFILKPHDERLPEMTPDDDTAKKPYTHQRLPLHTKPLIFHNGALDWQKANKVKPLDTPPEILFDVPDILVQDDLSEKLDALDIPNLAIQPAIYIDHKNQWHENYWYLTFTDVFDCWDREKSRYDADDEPVRLGGAELYDVYEYSLNNGLLDKTPLQSRLLFKMGGTLDGLIVAHVSVAKYFNRSGAVLVPITDYGVTYP